MYVPFFFNLKRGTPEFNEAAKSWLAWETYHQPHELAPWLKVQDELRPLLDQCDSLRAQLTPPTTTELA